ncbi:DUF748 domain-containing protein [Ohtaekwangia koreensis]|uniref:DUF748 domain-containing protein n=1 Tax=Ohtaekwangia koreensis TaxID=688867 RepID=A0A1T5LCM6_9BACT|nr:DUF748 domain-containing protein [Ohtaekwangia koreensis]SKC73455.1 protein of unknown function [Ohtaekwangia koreensis]
MKLSKKVWILIAVAAIIFAARLSMPYFVTRHVNKVLAAIPGYRYTLSDVDIYLYRGAYQLKELRVFKENENNESPFIYIPVIDLSVEWSAVLDAALVGQVTFENSELNFTGSKNSTNGMDVDWMQPIRALMPLRVNRIKITNGRIAYYDSTTVPHAELVLNSVNASAENLLNITEDPGMLPASAHLAAVTPGNGMLGVKIKMNVAKSFPDLEINLKFENADLKAWDDFLKAYPGIHIQQGNFNLYTEVVMMDGKTEGYISPVIENLKGVSIGKRKADDERAGWKSISTFLLANQSKDRLSTRVPITSVTSDSTVAVVPVLWNVLWEGFVKAFEEKREGTLKLKTVVNEDSGIVKQLEKKAKKEERKERRRKKREERKKKKEES